MPTYTYEIVETGELIELVHSIHDPALTRHPQTGKTLRRVITPAAINTRGPKTAKRTLSNENIAAKGFTKYVKDTPGHYVKVAGKGPDRISP